MISTTATASPATKVDPSFAESEVRIKSEPPFPQGEEEIEAAVAELTAKMVASPIHEPLRNLERLYGEVTKRLVSEVESKIASYGGKPDLDVLADLGEAVMFQNDGRRAVDDVLSALSSSLNPWTSPAAATAATAAKPTPAEILSKHNMVFADLTGYLREIREKYVALFDAYCAALDADENDARQADVIALGKAAIARRDAIYLADTAMAALRDIEAAE